MSKLDPPCEVPMVLEEIQSGDGLSLSAAGRLFPGHRGGKTTHPATVFRWVVHGSKIAGQVVKLEAVRVGNRWITSRPALARFVQALTDAANPTPGPRISTPTERRRAFERAAKELEAAGA